jgi:glutamine amidotransferase
MNRIAVIDYGMGNLHSVAKALELVSENTEVVLTADPQVVRDSDRVLLPGVGAIRDCIAEMRRLGVDAEVKEAIQSGKPFLGICVGYQALTDFSE